MKLKSTARKSAVIIGIILLALLCGYIYQLIGHRADLSRHPRQFEEYVEKYAAEYGVPVEVIYATVLNQSDFMSNCVSDDGRIGLMQLTPETLRWLTTMTKENLEAGILYDPETNIKYGTYMMSYLFTKYNRWKTVVAMMVTDEQTVNGWTADQRYSDEYGNLTSIPDESVAKRVAKIEEDIEMYRKLYYSEKNN